MILILIFLLSLLLINTQGEEPKDRSIFISPVKIPLSLSSNFGELRMDHFHSGLDVRTQGVTGKEVLAAASGYVYRISISPGGFGKALYLRHPSGYSTVYGHLDRFTPEIEEYVISRQYEEKSYMVTLWPPKERFKFDQGDVIAYSGNSGSSSGPHLHYEIRKSDDEVPVNPLMFEFGIKDNIKPVIEKLVIYPVGRKTLINNQNKQLKVNVYGGNGDYSISSKNEISISGNAGFGFKAYDLLNESYSKCAVYTIELKIDSLPVFNYKMDAFAFSESRYVNSHIDYETLQRENIYIERAFILPNDKLSAYGNVINNGIVNFADKRNHHVELIVSDIHGNKSVLSFYVNSVPAVVQENQAKTDENSPVVMPYNRNNKFVSKNIAVNIPSGALYDTLYFEFKRSAGNPLMFSDVYQIHNKYTPLHKTYNLSIKPDRIPAGKESKMLIIQLADDINKIPLPSTWNNGYLLANPGAFGTFFIGIDTIPPLISFNGFSSGANMTGKTSMKVKISDELSGIKTYEPVIDGKWALFEYDQKNNLLTYSFDPKRIQKDTKHNLILKVTDNCDNLSTFKCEFTW
jgi:hypothetical protein